MRLRACSRPALCSVQHPAIQLVVGFNIHLSHNRCWSRLTALPRTATCREAPPLTVAAVHVKTVLSPGSAANEVVAASVVYLQRVRTDGPMSQVTCLPDCNGAYEVAKSACRVGALLNRVAAFVQ